MMQSESTVSDSTPAATNATGGTNPDEKVLKDLDTLTEQIDLCVNMLGEAGDAADIDSNEALLAVIGFLEACAPRMVELVEAAAQGALKEDTLEKCLVVNDRLLKTLEDVDKPPNARQPRTAAASSAAKASDDTSGLEDLLDTSAEDYKPRTKLGAGKFQQGGKSTGTGDAVADPFAGQPDLLAPTPPSARSVPTDQSTSPIKPSGEGADDDDFDSFFRDRTSAGDKKD